MPRTRSSDVTSRRIGEEVRRSRAELGITQAELAKRLDVSPPYVAAIEAGQTNLTVGSLAAIADALGRGLDVLFPQVS